MSAWWHNAVVYEVYPRSFQDSDGDGIGDLRGITSRLSHLEWLGVDAIWIAPFFVSGGADFGYDIVDYRAVAPEYGTLEDLDALIGAAHDRGIRVLADLVPSHTSIEHPWFRSHPDRYHLADGPAPPNNWIAAFGGPAWSRDEATGRLYLHSHFAEQPDLDWRSPETRRAIADVVRFWLARGIDGFRVDAVDRMVKHAELLDDPPAGGGPALPVHPDAMNLDPVHSRNDPEIAVALGALREAAGEAPLFGEVYLPAHLLGPYLDHLDAVFAFDLLHSPWERDRLALALARSREAGEVAWVTSNHDFPRVASRWGERNARAAAVLLLTLGGTAFVYQGEEIGMADGPGGDPPLDRAGRDRCRHPMQWSAGPGAGFTDGVPWLPLVDPERRNVESQRDDPGSILNLFRELIALRRQLEGEPAEVEAPAGLLAFSRGAHLIAVNVSAEPALLRGSGEVALASSRDAIAEAAGGLQLAAHAAAVVRDV